MSNEEIIVKSAISAGIFSEEEAAAYPHNRNRMPPESRRSNQAALLAIAKKQKHIEIKK